MRKKLLALVLTLAMILTLSVPFSAAENVSPSSAASQPVFSLDIFNNGEGGSPSRPNASLYHAGFIRMWTQLDGAGTSLPYPDLSITAVFPDGTSAMQFVRVNRAWVEGQGWQNHFSSIDVLKGNGDWEVINFSITAFNQTVNVVLVNNRFIPPTPVPILTTTVYAEGWRETINIRFFLDGVLTALPLEDIVFIVDGNEVPDIREYTVNVAGWQTSTAAVFINKLAHNWQHIIVHISAYGQTVTHEFGSSICVNHVWCRDRLTGSGANWESRCLDCGWWGSAPLSEIFLTLVDDTAYWYDLDPGTVARTIETFDTLWADITAFFGVPMFDVEFRLVEEYHRIPTTVVVLDGAYLLAVLPENNPEGDFGIVYGAITDLTGFDLFGRNLEWNTDIFTRGLVQLAQGYYPVEYYPQEAEGFPGWIVDGLREYGRHRFGLYNYEAGWRLAQLDVYHYYLVPRAAGAMFGWLVETGVINESVLLEMHHAARTGQYPLRQGIVEPVTGGVHTFAPMQWLCDDQRQPWWQPRTGYCIFELWSMYEDANRAYMVPQPVGYATIAEAVAGRTIVSGARLHRWNRVPGGGGGNGSPSAEVARFMFDTNPNTKFLIMRADRGHFWVEWYYDRAFVPEAFLWQNGNDNEAYPRRMGTGWRLLGANIEDVDPERESVDFAGWHDRADLTQPGPNTNWTVLYVGTREDANNINSRYFTVCLAHVTESFTHFRLEAPNGGDSTIVQISFAGLITTQWECEHVFLPRNVLVSCQTDGYLAMMCRYCGIYDPDFGRQNIVPANRNGRHYGSGHFGPTAPNWELRLVPGVSDRWTHVQSVPWMIRGLHETYDLYEPGTKYWFEKCVECGDFALFSDIYLRWAEPPNSMDWADIQPDALNDLQGGGFFNAANRADPESRYVIDRLKHTFNMTIPLMTHVINFGEVFPIYYVLGWPGGPTGWASGNVAGVARAHLISSPWTAVQTHELSHNFQRYTFVPMWILEGLADNDREQYDMFQRRSNTSNPLFMANPNANDIHRGFLRGYSATAAFFNWINNTYGSNAADLTPGSLTAGSYWRNPEGINIIAENTPWRYFTQALNNTMKIDGRFHMDGRQFINITGYTVDELWTQYMEFGDYLRAARLLGPLGYATLAEAAGERNLIIDPIFIRGGTGATANEGPDRLFTPLQTQKFNARGGDDRVASQFWAEWRYSDPVVANSIILQTSNDSATQFRRMGNWYLAGSNDGETWTTIYEGTRDDLRNVNFRFFRVDLLGNTQAFTHYRIHSVTSGDTPNQAVPTQPQFVQLSLVQLTGTRIID
jgi:hypothetical protein